MYSGSEEWVGGGGVTHLNGTNSFSAHLLFKSNWTGTCCHHFKFYFPDLWRVKFPSLLSSWWYTKFLDNLIFISIQFKSKQETSENKKRKWKRLKNESIETFFFASCSRRYHAYRRHIPCQINKRSVCMHSVNYIST